MSWKPNSFYAKAISAVRDHGSEPNKAAQFKPAQNMLDCKDLGCKGDGVTDDTCAMQQAIDYARLRGCTLFISPGTYLVTTRLNIIGAVSILGSSPLESTILYNGALHDTADYALDYWPESNAAISIQANNCILKNFTLIAGDVAHTSNGIIFHTPSVTNNNYSSVERCTLEHIDILHFKNGIFSYAGWNRHITLCHFVNNIENGIKWAPLELSTVGNWSGSGDVVSACQFVGNGVAGVNAESLFETTFWECVFEYNAHAISVVNCNDITFKNCWNEANTGNILVTGCARFEGGYNIQPSTVTHTVVGAGDIVVFEAKAGTIIKAGSEIVFNQQGGIITKGVQLAAELTNLFTNPTFGTVETPGTVGWNVYVAPTADSVTKYAGENTAHYNISGYTEDQGFGARQIVPVVTGKSYNFSIYVMTSDKNTIDSTGLTCYVAHKNAAGDTSWLDNRTLTTIFANNVWELKTVVIAATGDDASLEVGFGCARNGDVHFAQPLLARSDILVANDVFVRIQDATHLEVINMSGVKVGTIPVTPV